MYKIKWGPTTTKMIQQRLFWWVLRGACFLTLVSSDNGYATRAVLVVLCIILEDMEVPLVRDVAPRAIWWRKRQTLMPHYLCRECACDKNPPGISKYIYYSIV